MENWSNEQETTEPHQLPVFRLLQLSGALLFKRLVRKL